MRQERLAEKQGQATPDNIVVSRAWPWHWGCLRLAWRKMQKLQGLGLFCNGQARRPSAPGVPPPAPARPAGHDSTTRPVTGDMAQCSTMTSDESTPSAQPCQPANRVSSPTKVEGKPDRQPGTTRTTTEPSYESDNKDEAAGQRLVQESGLASQDDAKVIAAAAAVTANVPSDDAADVSTGALLPQAPKSPAAETSEPSGEAPVIHRLAPDADDAGAAASATGVYDIDLDIDLTKGNLKLDYSAGGLLGQGGFAAVYKGCYKGHSVAVKMMKKASSSLMDLQEEDMKALVHELHILCQVSHPNIVRLHGGCLKPPHIFLVEERMEGTLDSYVHHVRKHDALNVREVIYFALDIACGLSYLHPRIVHRDLKPANVLLSQEGYCKISDFGLARTKMKEYLSTKNLDAGTTAYVAPECFMSMDNPDMHDLRRSVTDRTDIYALGIIMWEMLASKRPWQGVKPLLVAYQVAYRSLRPPLFELGSRCPAKLRQLIEDCWCQEPKLRPSSQQVVDRLLGILRELAPEQIAASPMEPVQPAAAVAGSDTTPISTPSLQPR